MPETIINRIGFAQKWLYLRKLVFFIFRCYNEYRIKVKNNPRRIIRRHFNMQDKYDMSMIRVAVCGNLPTACDYLMRQGIVQIDQYEYATDLTGEATYHLILIYAPNAEGIFDTVYVHDGDAGSESSRVPIRLLNEPCCHSALLELKSLLRRISRSLAGEGSMGAALAE